MVKMFAVWDSDRIWVEFTSGRHQWDIEGVQKTTLVWLMESFPRMFGGMSIQTHGGTEQCNQTHSLESNLPMLAGQ